VNTLDTKYLNLCKTILAEGVRKPNRTGTDTIATSGLSIRHDMSDGFPLITTKKMAYKTCRVELEGFIGGQTSKKWYQDRGCKIWNEWCNPRKVPYGTDDETHARMAAEDDLGEIYGAQWRNFHDPSLTERSATGINDGVATYFNGGRVDQLENIVRTLKTNPSDRRMICSAWNPLALDRMALPPCHFAWQVVVVGDRLDLIWTQRSCDFPIGAPFNIVSYATLLHLLAKESGYKEGILTGNFGDIHIYENCVDAIKEQLTREPYDLPTIETENFTSIFDWKAEDTKLIGYKSHPAIKMDVSV